MVSAQMLPVVTLTVANQGALNKLKTYLDSLGYTVGGPIATRVDAGLTVTITYPTWTMEIP